MKWIVISLFGYPDLTNDDIINPISHENYFFKQIKFKQKFPGNPPSVLLYGRVCFVAKVPAMLV